MCWSGATGRCTTKGVSQDNKTSIKFTARGPKASGGVFMVGYSVYGLSRRHSSHRMPRGWGGGRLRRGGAFCKGINCTATAGVALLNRLVGRNLRLSRADPTLCFGRPSPLRCALLSPQGLTTLRGPIQKRLGVNPKTLTHRNARPEALRPPGA